MTDTHILTLVRIAATLPHGGPSAPVNVYVFDGGDAVRTVDVLITGIDDETLSDIANSKRSDYDKISLLLMHAEDFEKQLRGGTADLLLRATGYLKLTNLREYVKRVATLMPENKGFQALSKGLLNQSEEDESVPLSPHEVADFRVLLEEIRAKENEKIFKENKASAKKRVRRAKQALKKRERCVSPLGI